MNIGIAQLTNIRARASMKGDIVCPEEQALQSAVRVTPFGILTAK
jgi:hypothetical protein